MASKSRCQAKAYAVRDQWTWQGQVQGELARLKRYNLYYNAEVGWTFE
jgi:hypothetical protein